MNTTCKKVSYSTKEFALQDIDRFKLKNDNRTKPNSTYKCNKCNTWHLTKRIDFKEENIILNKKIKIQEEFIKKLKSDLENTPLNNSKQESELVWFKKYQKKEEEVIKLKNKIIEFKNSHSLKLQIISLKKKNEIYFLNMEEKQRESIFFLNKIKEIMNQIDFSTFIETLNLWRTENESIRPKNLLKSMTKQE